MLFESLTLLRSCSVGLGDMAPAAKKAKLSAGGTGNIASFFGPWAYRKMALSGRRG